MRIAVFLLLVLVLAGCSRMQRTGKWPSLAPRVGEVSPLVPRTPLGACAGCGADVFAAAPAPPAIAPTPVSADVAVRIEQAAKAIAAVAARLPEQRRALAAAVSAAAGGPADSNAAAAAEIERSRFELLFVPLSVEEKALDAIDDDLIGKAGAEGLLERVSALRRELGRLEGERLSVPD